MLILRGNESKLVYIPQADHCVGASCPYIDYGCYCSFPMDYARMHPSRFPPYALLFRCWFSFGRHRFQLKSRGIMSVSFTSARKAVTSASGTASFYKLLTAKVTAFLEWLKQVCSNPFGSPRITHYRLHDFRKRGVKSICTSEGPAASRSTTTPGCLDR